MGNAVCGDIMRVYLDIDENNVIRDASSRPSAAAPPSPQAPMATVLVKGKTVQEALEVTNKAVMEALDGLPPVKVHCSLLAEEAIHAALWDYAEKNGIIEGRKPVSDISEHDHGHGDDGRRVAAGSPTSRWFDPGSPRASGLFSFSSRRAAKSPTPTLHLSRPARAGKSLDSRPQRR